MKVLIDVAPAELPEAYQRLIDPEKPLEAPERFAPAAREGGFLSWLLLAVAVVFLGLMCVPAVRTWTAFLQGQPHDVVNLFTAPVIGGLAFWLAWRQMHNIHTGREQARQQAQGRYRIGMFLEPDAALFYDGARCTLVPRQSVTDVDLRAAPNVGSGAKAKGGYLVFLDSHGSEHARALPDIQWVGPTTNWFKRGKLPKKPT